MKDFLLSHALAVACFIMITIFSFSLWNEYNVKKAYERGKNVTAELIDYYNGSNSSSVFRYNNREYNADGFPDGNEKIGEMIVVRYDEKSDSLYTISDSPDQMGACIMIIIVCSFCMIKDLTKKEKPFIIHKKSR